MRAGRGENSSQRRPFQTRDQVPIVLFRADQTRWRNSGVRAIFGVKFVEPGVQHQVPVLLGRGGPQPGESPAPFWAALEIRYSEQVMFFDLEGCGWIEVFRFALDGHRQCFWLASQRDPIYLAFAQERSERLLAAHLNFRDLPMERLVKSADQVERHLNGLFPPLNFLPKRP